MTPEKRTECDERKAEWAKVYGDIADLELAKLGRRVQNLQDGSCHPAGYEAYARDLLRASRELMTELLPDTGDPEDTVPELDDIAGMLHSLTGSEAEPVYQAFKAARGRIYELEQELRVMRQRAQAAEKMAGIVAGFIEPPMSRDEWDKISAQLAHIDVPDEQQLTDKECNELVSETMF